MARNRNWDGGAGEPQPQPNYFFNGLDDSSSSSDSFVSLSPAVSPVRLESSPEPTQFPTICGSTAESWVSSVPYSLVPYYGNRRDDGGEGARGGREVTPLHGNSYRDGRLATTINSKIESLEEANKKLRRELEMVKAEREHEDEGRISSLLEVNRTTHNMATENIEAIQELAISVKDMTKTVTGLTTNLESQGDTINFLGDRVHAVNRGLLNFCHTEAELTQTVGEMGKQLDSILGGRGSGSSQVVAVVAAVASGSGTRDSPSSSAAVVAAPLPDVEGHNEPADEAQAQGPVVVPMDDEDSPVSPPEELQEMEVILLQSPPVPRPSPVLADLDGGRRPKRSAAIVARLLLSQQCTPRPSRQRRVPLPVQHPVPEDVPQRAATATNENEGRLERDAPAPAEREAPPPLRRSLRRSCKINNPKYDYYARRKKLGTN